MESYIYTASAAVLGVIATLFYNSRNLNPVTPPPQSDTTEFNRKILEKIEDLATPRQPEENRSSLERIEELERRFERLHKDCLRYLQQGNQSWKRIQDRAENDEYDESEISDQAASVMSNAPVPENETDSDLEWAKRALIDRGETPIV